jgi:protein-tyrosine-phosphatase
VALLEANGIDIKEAYPKPLTDDVVRASDYVVTMGCGDACPIYPGKQYLDWDVADLDGATEAEAKVIYEDIRGRVQSLWKQLSD